MTFYCYTLDSHISWSPIKDKHLKNTNLKYKPELNIVMDDGIYKIKKKPLKKKITQI